MGIIADIPEFDKPVYQLETTDPIKGGLRGISNRQSITLANRTLYLKELLELVSDRPVVTVNDKVGEVILSYEDINADPAGTAEEILRLLIETDEPFNGYMTITLSEEEFVKKGSGNQPNGPFKLNKDGKVPAELLEPIVSRYVVVDNESERLDLTQIDNVTICFQNDTRLTYYLNPGQDPSDPDLWLEGTAHVYTDVLGVFGRTKDVKSETGDYTTDQIIPTEERGFASPQEISQWENKLEKLRSGTNIKYLNGVSVLGSGNLPLTPEWFGVAKGLHNHNASDIIDITDDITRQLLQKLGSGSGIDISVDAQTGALIITATSTDNPVPYVVVKKEQALADEVNTYLFSNQRDYGLGSFVLKEISAPGEDIKWVKQSTEQVEIRWGARDVSFIPKTPGTYYFGYQVP